MALLPFFSLDEPLRFFIKILYFEEANFQSYSILLGTSSLVKHLFLNYLAGKWSYKLPQGTGSFFDITAA